MTSTVCREAPGGNSDVSGTGLLHHLYVLHVRMLTQCHAISWGACKHQHYHLYVLNVRMV